MRRILPGTTYYVTRKTNDDQFLLRPDGAVNAVLLYLLIDKLNKYKLLLHEFIFMSSHLHLVVTDCHGKLPHFMRDFLGESAKAVKLTIKTTRRIWSGKRYSATSILDLDAAVRMMIYTRVNPTKAGLTKPEDWPGLTSVHWKYGDTIVAKRPDVYFSAKRPAEVSCVLEPLPELFGDAAFNEQESSHPTVKPDHLEQGSSEDLGEESSRGTLEKDPCEAFRRRCEALQARIDRGTAAKVAEILEHRTRNGTTGTSRMAGEESVRNASRLSRGGHPFGDVAPRFAASDPRILRAALDDEKGFLASHELARIRYVNGEQKVLFPAGTFGYRELLWVRVKRRSRRGGAAAA